MITRNFHLDVSEHFDTNESDMKSVLFTEVTGLLSPDFGISVNPIPIGGGGRLCPPNNTGPPGFSDLPPALGLCSEVGHRTYFTAPYMKNMLCTKIVLNVKTKTTICVHNMFSRYSELTIFMNNLSSYCGLVDAKIRASDKDLPVS